MADNGLTKKTLLKATLVLIAGITVLLLLKGPLARGYEAVILAAELGGFSPPSLIYHSPHVSSEVLCLSHNSRQFTADLYLSEHSPVAGIVLLHGATPDGKDDPRLTEFAKLLAARRFAVLVPELIGPQHRQIDIDDTQPVVDAFRFLNNYPGVESQVGIGGFSVSAGLGFLAALRPEIGDDVAFIVSIGGYHSLPRTLDYAITGQYELEGIWHRQSPNPYGKWLFVLSNLETLQEAVDQWALRRIANRRIASEQADISDLEPLLTPEGQAVLTYLTKVNHDHMNVQYLALPSAMREHIEALDLANKPLQQLSARVLLIHGRDDTIIPYSESIALARELPPNQVELYLVQGLHHVDSKLDRLQDIWHFWRACYALLQQRDRDAT